MMAENKEGKPSKVVEVPAINYIHPSTFVNHVQLIKSGGMTYLDFRLIIPDLFSKEAKEVGSGPKDLGVVADLSVLQPHARVSMTDDIAISLRDVLLKNFPKKDEA